MIDHSQDARLERSVPRKLRVVLVDDSPTTLIALVRMLVVCFGIDVAGQAADGPEGLALATEVRPDLVIADLDMPGYGGLELAARLRNGFPEMRSIIISSHDGDAWHKLSRLHGADGFISKERLHEELPLLLRKLFADSDHVVTPFCV